MVDAKGIRSVDTPLYAAASFACLAVTLTVYALATGRSHDMVQTASRIYWRRFAAMGVASGVTYALVQIVFQRAPVG